MYLLIEIRDGTNPTDLSKETFVDLYEHRTIDDAVIAAEPNNMENEIFIVVDEAGEFGVIPKTDAKYVPNLVHKWNNPSLASFYFDRYGQQKA